MNLPDLLNDAADAIRPAQNFTPDEEVQLLASYRAGMARLGGQAAAQGAQDVGPLVRWLSRAFRSYGRQTTFARVATFLAVIEPDGDDVTIRRIVKAVHVSGRDVTHVLARLEADGFIEITPTIAVSSERIRLIL